MHMRFHSWISRRYPWLPEKIRAYIDLVRPFTLLAPLLGCIAFGLFALIADPDQDLGWPELKILVYGAVTLMLLNAGSNIWNQANEVQIDRINKPDRPIPAGRVDELEAVALSVVLYFIAMARAVFMPFEFALCVYALVAITLAYSAGPYLKRRYVLNNLSMALARGYLGPWAAWCLFGDPFSPVVHGACLVLAVWTFGSISTKDFADLEGDRANGVRTFPVVIGIRRTRHIVTASMIAPFILVPVMIQARWFVSSMVWFLLLSPIGAAIVALLYTDRDTASIVENRTSWVLMYVLFMAMLLSFPVLYLLA